MEKKKCKLIRKIQTTTYGSSLLNQSLKFFKISASIQKFNSADKNHKGAIIFAAGLDCLSGSSSSMLAQIVHNFCAENEDNMILLSSFDVYFFPEINPDCILLGNSKLSLSGCDLSTVEKCSKTLHPELYYFFKTLEEIEKKQPVVFFFEIRDSWKIKGHCLTGTDMLDKPKQVRELPALMSEFCSFFSFANCEFLPVGCFQGFLAQSAKIINSSFCYSIKIATNDNGHGHVFQRDDFNRLADNFIHSLAILCVNRFKNVF